MKPHWSSWEGNSPWLCGWAGYRFRYVFGQGKDRVPYMAPPSETCAPSLWTIELPMTCKVSWVIGTGKREGMVTVFSSSIQHHTPFLIFLSILTVLCVSRHCCPYLCVDCLASCWSSMSHPLHGMGLLTGILKKESPSFLWCALGQVYKIIAAQSLEIKSGCHTNPSPTTPHGEKRGDSSSLNMCAKQSGDYLSASQPLDRFSLTFWRPCWFPLLSRSSMGKMENAVFILLQKSLWHHVLMQNDSVFPCFIEVGARHELSALIWR